MNRFRKAVLLCFLGLVMSFGASASQDDDMFVPQPISVPNGANTNAQSVADAIRRALKGRGWEIVDEKPGLITAKLTKPGDWSATISASYDAHEAQFHYVDSSKLLYHLNSDGVPKIHHNYNRWIKYLCEDTLAYLNSKTPDV